MDRVNKKVKWTQFSIIIHLFYQYSLRIICEKRFDKGEMMLLGGEAEV
jgi:hypothetical protein